MVVIGDWMWLGWIGKDSGRLEGKGREVTGAEMMCHTSDLVTRSRTYCFELILV